MNVCVETKTNKSKAFSHAGGEESCAPNNGAHMCYFDPKGKRCHAWDVAKRNSEMTDSEFTPPFCAIMSEIGARPEKYPRMMAEPGYWKKYRRKDDNRAERNQHVGLNCRFLTIKDRDDFYKKLDAAKKISDKARLAGVQFGYVKAS